MRLIDANSAAAYLRETGRIESDEPVHITELTGGVSNVVLFVKRPGDHPDFVLKQARERLRVAEPWFCSVERIWREVEVLRVCERVLAEETYGVASTVRASTPRLLFADDQNFLFAMSAAPAHDVWKQHLLTGHVEPNIARACGGLLGRLHIGTWDDASVARELGDRSFFDDLRISPYYRHVGAAHPSLQPTLNQLIDSIEANCCSLVHGDFSPKNLLVAGSTLVLVDFEVGHFGDPAFDLGFFLSHLALKSLWAESADRRGAGQCYLALTTHFWDAYREQMCRRLDVGSYSQLVRRAIQHFAACMLARVDGKSPVDYLRPETQDVARNIAIDLLRSSHETWDQVLPRLQ